MRDTHYGKDFPYFCFAVSFENSGSDYKYNLRFNMSSNEGRTEAPNTNENLTTLSPNKLSLYLTSALSGFIGVSTMANNIILQTEISDSDDMIVNKIGPIYQE